MITRYEITAVHPDGRKWLVGYTPRKSRPGLLAAMRNVAAPLMNKLPIGDADKIEWGTKPLPWASVSGFKIAFTGRTQLDAQREGELPFIAKDWVKTQAKGDVVVEQRDPLVVTLNAPGAQGFVLTEIRSGRS